MPRRLIRSARSSYQYGIISFQFEWTAAAIGPPTDTELLNRGLGFHPTAPPDIVAGEINAQLNSIRTGLTPRRKNPRPPSDPKIRLDLAIAKAEADRRISPIGDSGPPQMGRAVEPAPMEAGSRAGPSLTGPPLSSHNGYSLGASLPKGSNWRYVDVLNNPDVLK